MPLTSLNIRDPRQITRTRLDHSTPDLEFALERGKILNRARETFGYSAEVFDAAGPLRQALIDLEIEPLNETEVKLYQQGKERQRVWEPKKMARRGLVLGIMAVAVAVHFALAAHGTTDLFTLYFVPVLVMVMLGAIGGALVDLIVFDSSNENGRERAATRIKTWAWQEFWLGQAPARTMTPDQYRREQEDIRWGNAPAPLASYKRYVPLHVLDRAVRIREVCPEAEFVVEELTLTVKKVPVPLPDPFLLVRLGSERFYVDVWDEREFEARR